MLAVVDRHKIHTSIGTFVEDKLGETIGETWCRCLLFLCYMEIEVQDFPSHRHHLSSSFVNNTILDINYWAFAGAEDRRVTVKQHVFLHSIRIWRWKIVHFWPSRINRKYSQMRRQPKFSSKKEKRSAFPAPNHAKLCTLDCRILYEWQSTGSIVILRRYLPLSFSSTVPLPPVWERLCLPRNLVTGADAPTRPANLLPTTILCVNKGAGRFKRDTTWWARSKISKVTANAAKSVESKTHMWGKPGSTANK